MVFAQMTVEAPKNGAISRAAAISAPSELKPTASTSASSGARRRTPARDVVTGGGSPLEGREVDLPGAADGAVPVVGDLLERRPRRDPAVRVALPGVIDEPTGLTHPARRRLRRHATAY